MSELYKKYRPRTLKGIVGQDGAKATLQMFIDQGNIPHSQLYIGPSGCGKTTAARVMQKALDCGDADLMEINSADDRGVDVVRKIRKAASMTPMGGAARLFVLDECHKLTNEAQNALLKILEDSPKKAYFILCTTDPQKVLKAVRTRCTEVKFGLLNHAMLEKVCKRVIKREEFNVSDDCVDEIVEAAEGSARKALVILEQIAGIEDPKEQIKAVESVSFSKEEAIKLAQTIFAVKPQWPVIAAVLKGIENEDSEGIRYMILGYARSILLKQNGGKMAEKAAAVIDIFSEPTFNTKHAGLAAYAWEAHQL